ACRSSSADVAVCSCWAAVTACSPVFFSFQSASTTEIHTLSLHDALPIFHDTKEDIDSALADVPDNLDEAEDPTFEIGSEAIIEANHMEGMDGAEATITGAYDTIAYSVSFTPTTGGEPVKDHKWVIHEELAGVNEDSLEPG